MKVLEVLSAGPGVCVQDLGRPGYLAQGIGRGGAADRSALFEAACLLGQKSPAAAIEMAGFGGKFRPDCDCQCALTGAPMRASVDGQPIPWNTSFVLAAGSVLEIGSALSGVYGYLSISAGFDAPSYLGSRSMHSNAGLGRYIRAGDQIALGEITAKNDFVPNQTITVEDRFNGGRIPVIASPQIELFEGVVAEFEAADLVRTQRGNRMGVELDGGRPFGASGGQGVVSEMISPGDIQMTGAGQPFILGPDCQTTGGYPRIATVIPSALDRAMQVAPGTKVSVEFVTREVAMAALRTHETARRALRAHPRIRDVSDISDLLSYQLIDGAITGEET